MIKKIIENSIKKFNLNNKKKDHLKFLKNFQILGPESKLDSLKLVNFFIEIENNVKKKFKKDLNLLDDSFFEKNYNFKYTIQDLENDIKKKIK
tara:strand:+ start:1405 stop:1683 length:279 start_codon:yes stop_codon:yes gene_type:complete